MRIKFINTDRDCDEQMDHWRVLELKVTSATGRVFGSAGELGVTILYGILDETHTRGGGNLPRH